MCLALFSWFDQAELLAEIAKIDRLQQATHATSAK